MGSAEGIVDVYISEFGETCTELLDLGRVCLGLVALLILDRALLFDVETKVLKENDGARCSFVNGLLDLWADTFVEEDDWLAELCLKLLCNRSKGVLFDDFAIRTSEVGHQGDGLGACLINEYPAGHGR